MRDSPVRPPIALDHTLSGCHLLLLLLDVMIVQQLALVGEQACITQHFAGLGVASCASIVVLELGIASVFYL